MKLCLNGIYESAIENDICLKNPVKNIKVNSNLESEPRKTYSSAEANNILELSDSHRYGVYIRILLELGLRCSELCGLKWSDFDFDEKTVSIKRACTEEDGKAVISKTKNESSTRTLPISSELCERLKDSYHKSKDDFLLKSRKGKDGLPVTPSSFAECRYKTFFNDMKLDKILTPHECRHADVKQKTQNIHININQIYKLTFV